MATLTLDFRYGDIGLRIKGISFKALKGTRMESHLIRSDAGGYAIDTIYSGIIDRKTNQPYFDKLVGMLTEIKQASELYFDKVKVVGYSHFTGEQIMNAINEKIKADEKESDRLNKLFKGI